MKSLRFWIIRFFTILAAITGGLTAVYALQGQPLADAVKDAAMWAVLASAILIGSRYYKASQGVPCAMCRDTVDQSQPES